MTRLTLPQIAEKMGTSGWRGYDYVQCFVGGDQPPRVSVSVRKPGTESRTRVAESVYSALEVFYRDRLRCRFWSNQDLDSSEVVYGEEVLFSIKEPVDGRVEIGIESKISIEGISTLDLLRAYARNLALQNGQRSWVTKRGVRREVDVESAWKDINPYGAR